MHVPRPLFNALVPPAPLRRPLHDWRMVLGDDFKYAAAFLLPENTRPSNRVLCGRACCAERRLAVFPDGNGQCLSTCQTVGAEVLYEPLPLEETLWRGLDVPGLLRAMAAPWDVRPGGEADTGIPGAWRIGHLPALKQPLYFIRPAAPRGAADIIARLLQTTGDAALFLVPAPACIDDDCHTLLAPRQSRILPLDEAFALDGAGQWRALTTLNVSRDNAPEDRYLFRRMGASWLMVYDGTAFHINHTQGCPVLAVLLENPRRSFTHLALKRIVDGKAEPRTRQNPIEVVDREARIDLDASIDQLQSFIDPEGDPAEQAEQREQLENLLKQRNAARGLGGKTRIVRDDGEKARQSVGKNLVTVLRAIGAANTDAGRHFAAFSPMAHELTYSPPEDVSWVVERK